MVFVMSCVLEKEWEQNAVDLLGCCIKGIVTILFAIFDNQENADLKSDNEVDKDMNSVILLESIRQWARVGQEDFSFMGAVQLDLAYIQIKYR